MICIDELEDIVVQCNYLCSINYDNLFINQSWSFENTLYFFLLQK